VGKSRAGEDKRRALLAGHDDKSKGSVRAQVLALLTAGEIDQREAGLPGLISKKRRVLLASRV